MEEDIKNIERVIDYIQLESPIIQGLGNAIYTDSLKRLIKGYRELEEENEELKRLANNKQWISPCYVAQNYIPKSKVKEKIEELSFETYGLGNQPELWEIKEQIKLLQELMEDK